MAGFKDRLFRLETSLSPRNAYYHGSRARLEAKLQAISSSQREHRDRGEEPNLDGQSMASLLALALSYPYGEVPPAVVHAVRSKAQELSCDPHSAVAKMVRLCLTSKGI